MGRVYDATWGRLFAALYDRGLAATEEAGLGEMRRELLAGAKGRVIDVGAGTGVNVELFPDAVSELLLAEPDPHMARQLRAKLPGMRREAVVVEATAEDLPFPADSFDVVVATLVLCTTPDPAAALRELARVLRPGGRLLFIEHVRSGEERSARWQDRLERPWRFLANGCHCNRDTLATLQDSPFEPDAVERDELPKSLPLVKPLIRGGATLPSP